MRRLFLPGGTQSAGPQLFESTLAALYKLPDKTETPVSLQHWSSWWSEATQIRTIAPWGILGGNFIESDGFCAVFVVERNQNFFHHRDKQHSRMY